MLPNTYLPDSTPCLISFSYTSQFHTMLKNLLTFLFLLLAISVATAQAANDDCASPVAITIGEVVDFSTMALLLTAPTILAALVPMILFLPTFGSPSLLQKPKRCAGRTVAQPTTIAAWLSMPRQMLVAPATTTW